MASRGDPDGRYWSHMLKQEKLILIEALKATGGNMMQTSKYLGLPRATLYVRMKHCGIDPNLVRLELDTLDGAK